ncbi:MAG TPA: hypothetical protein ENG61_03555 [Candidatus Korarchaeota archaeon]|nr:hypothetical protein [Candidatus Korarchaeota archaeon]
MISTDISVWIAAFFTIAATSYVFKDNIIFKFAEYTFIGVAAGHALVMGFENIKKYGWSHLVAGEYIYVIPFIVGILMDYRYHPKYYWLYRYGIAFLVGQGIGLSMRGMVHTDFIKQIAATAGPLTAETALGTFNAIIIFILTITCLTHFIFTIRQVHIGTVSWLPKIGRYGMLLAFGAAFGNTVMTRFSQYQGRMLFLLRDWLGIAAP